MVEGDVRSPTDASTPTDVPPGGLGVVAGRYRLLRQAGAGATGTVFCADDLRTGQRVALKVLSARRDLPTRFFHEAAVLSELHHPAVVRLEGHGSLDDGSPYVAMEWLEGEPLDQRLDRGPLSIDDTVALARRVLGGLAVAHRRGIVHRDLKPANLFLVGGEVAQAKILDFGIATRMSASTERGRAVGTPFYMSPEQARGQAQLDARSDLFSLGAVLYECLTGRPPFVAESVVAVLAKICIADPPPPESLRDDVPAAFADLVTQMLRKRAADRPSDAEHVQESLTTLGRGNPTPVPPMASGGLSADERRVLCVLVASRGGGSGLLAANEAATQDLPGAGESVVNGLEDRIAGFGGQAHALVDGSVVVTLAEHVPPPDQAARAARCALMIKQAVPTAVCAISTGRAVMFGRVPLGDAIDDGVLRLQDASPGDIRLDESTAALLGRRFDVHTQVGHYVLLGEREHTPVPSVRANTARTPFLGRAPDLERMRTAFEGALAERRPRGLVVTGPPGLGKSRLRIEFLEELARGGRGVTLLFAEGDPLRGGVPYGIVTAALTAALRFPPRAEPAERRRLLEQWVRARVPSTDVERIAAFLGELVDAPFPDGYEPLLRSARQDPRVKAEQIQNAFVDVLRAESVQRPVLIVLEDLHWADAPSVQLVNAALRDERASALLVIALARPELDEQHPQLWQGRRVERAQLAPLPEESCRDLARHLLGPDQDDTAQWIAGRVGGNPFFVEETARVLRRRRRTELPEAVLGTVQARLDDLPAQARKVLRAASVFGHHFTRDDVLALLGPDEHEGIDRWLTLLRQEDLVGSAGPGPDAGLAFRQQLFQQAAYESLTEGDRIFGHRTAARHLEAQGAVPAIVLVEHYERGGDRARAAHFCIAAAETALAEYDLDGAIQIAWRGVRLGVSSEREGTLELVQAKAYYWKGDAAEGEGAGQRALRKLPPGTRAFFEAAEATGMLCYLQGAIDRLALVGEHVAATPANDADAGDQRVLALVAIASPLLFSGRLEGVKLLQITDAEAIDHLRPITQARWYFARGVAASVVDGRRDLAIRHGRAALEHAERAGARLEWAELAVALGAQLLEVGAYEEAEAIQDEVLRIGDRARSRYLRGFALANLASIRTYLGRLEEAARDLAGARELLGGLDEARSAPALALYASRLAQRRGAWDEALAEAERAAAKEASPGFRIPALANLALVELAHHEPAAARAHAEEACVLLETPGVRAEEDDHLPYLALALAHEASGDLDAARKALTTARRRLLESLTAFVDPELRASALARVPTNARILELAATWQLEDPAAAA